MKNSFGDLAVDLNDFGDSPLTSLTLADRNFNPGNLRFVGQSGAVEGEKGFAKFDSYEAGYDALKRQIELDGNRGLKLGEFIGKYAPASENNTAAYKSFVAKQTGYNLDSAVSDLDKDVLANAIIKQEGGSYSNKNINSFGDAVVIDAIENSDIFNEKNYNRINNAILNSHNKPDKYKSFMSVGKISPIEDIGLEDTVKSDLSEFDRFKGNLKTGAAGVVSSSVKSIGAFADYLRALDEQKKKEREGGVVSDFEKRGDLSLAGIERAESISKTAKEFATTVDEKFPDMPERKGIKGFYDDVVTTAPQIFSQAVSYAVGGVPTSVLFMGSQILGGKYDKLVTEDNVDPVRAFQASLVDATAQAGLEQIGLNKALKFWKPSGKSVKLLRETAEIFGVEWFTEFVQSFVDSATDIWGKAVKENKSPSEQVDQFIQDFTATAATGAYEGLVTAPFAMLSPGAKVAKQGLQNVINGLPEDVQERVREFTGIKNVVGSDKIVDDQQDDGVGEQGKVLEGDDTALDDQAVSNEDPFASDPYVPDKVFVSKKGNYYERINNVWFDSEGEEVVDKFKLKAAEKGAKDYVPPNVEEQSVADSGVDSVVSKEEVGNNDAGSVQAIAEQLGADINLEPGVGLDQVEEAKRTVINLSGTPYEVPVDAEVTEQAEVKSTPESLAESVNQFIPGLDLKFDGVFDRTALNKSPLYQFTPQSGEFKGRTIAVDELSEEAVVGKLSGMGVKPERSKVDELAEEKIQASKEESTFYSGIDPIKAVKSVRSIFSSDSPTFRNLRLTGKAAGELFLDPERVMKRDPNAKKSFYELVNAEENKNAFLYRNWEQYKKSVKGIKEGSKEAERVGKALDGKLNPDELYKNERRAYDFYKQNYEALITEYAQKTAGSKEAYDRILNAVKSGSMKKTLVKDLVGEDKINFWRLREEINGIRKGKKLSELSAEDLRSIDALKAEQKSILHNDWKRKLPENEAAVYDILSRKVNDYLPRMFDPEELKITFQTELADAKAKLAKTTSKVTETKLKNVINKYEKALKVMSGGGMVTFDQLPSSVFFKFFSPRTGKSGYSFDAVKAYKSYLFGIAKKMFDEPAAQKIAKEYYDKIEDRDLKDYTEDLVRHYLGMNRSRFDWIAGNISTFEWMRTLGLNPRSALVNLSQRLNTVMYAGVKYSLLAQHEMDKEIASFGKYKSEASKAFDESGIAREVPNVMTEGDTPSNLEGVKSIVGSMFNTVELSNRKHAYMAGYMKAKAAGESVERCKQMGQKTVHKTQFRYGKLGMPKVYRSPLARVGLQFSSYTLKQAQFIYDLADGFKTKEGMLRFLKYVMYTQGIAWTLKELLDADLSSAIGLNISWGEAIKGIVALVEGDWESVVRHFKMTFNDGEGVMPSMFGPAVTGAIKVYEGSEKGEGVKALVKEITPVMFDRIKAFLNAEQRPDGTYVVKGQSDNALYNLTEKQLYQRTFGPKSAEETKVQRQYKEETLLKGEKTRGVQAVIDAFLEKDMEKFQRELSDNKAAMLVVMSQKGLFEKMVEAEIMKRKFTQEERVNMKKKPGADQVYKVVRE